MLSNRNYFLGLLIKVSRTATTCPEQVTASCGLLLLRKSVMWLIQTLVYCIGVVLLVLAGVFCLATGLYTAAEWLEDHVKTTFRIIKRGLIFCISLQLLWLVLDRQLFWPNLVGLVSHANSWLMLNYHYPNHMGLEQPPTIAALVLLVVHQTAWVLTWAHQAGSLLNVAAVLATVVWPIPIMLLLSAGTESDLPTRMPAPVHGEFNKGSIPSSPLTVSQPGSPFVDAAARLRMRHSLQHRSSSGDGRLPTPTDTTHQPDQGSGYQSVPLGTTRHSRQGSGGSIDGGSSFSSSISAAWGLAERLQQQQQQGFKKHRSRFVQAVHKMQELAGVRQPTVLPVALDAHKR